MKQPISEAKDVSREVHDFYLKHYMQLPPELSSILYQAYAELEDFIRKEQENG